MGLPMYWFRLKWNVYGRYIIKADRGDGLYPRPVMMALTITIPKAPFRLVSTYPNR